MKLTVCMITYNHENYISEAIESVLSQHTDFQVQLVIGEDCSTDNTRIICEDFAKKNPDKILLLPVTGNLGMMKNFVRTFNECDGDYISFLEGDDYWTDELKLQKQVNFLKANPDYSLCFHNTQMKMDRNNEKKEWVLHNKLEKDTFVTEDVLGPWFVPSCAVVFSNYPDFVLPPWFYNCKYGDLPFMLLLSLKGKFKYINEVMSVYRLHDTGMSSVHKAYDKITVMIYIYESFNFYTNYKFQETIRQSIKYEIDRHIPKAEVKPLPVDKPTIFTRLYKKLKIISG
jgi:glycosyltransferase involved in cell wall biosynthesis